MPTRPPEENGRPSAPNVTSEFESADWSGSLADGRSRRTPRPGRIARTCRSSKRDSALGHEPAHEDHFEPSHSANSSTSISDDRPATPVVLGRTFPWRWSRRAV